MRSSEDAPAPLSAGNGLKVKLVWLTVFRTVTTSLFLFVVAARLFTRPPAELTPEDSGSFVLIGLVYLLNLVYGLWLRRGAVGPRGAYVQVLGDVLLSTALVYLTGGVGSPFTVAYAIAIIAAALMLFQRGALIAFGASAAAFVSLILLVRFGVLRPPLYGSALSVAETWFVAGSNLLAQLLIAVLAAYLSRELSLTGRRLFAREEDLRKLEALQRQILASMPSGLITCTTDGRVTYVNAAAGSILHIDPNAPWTRRIEDLIPGALSLPPRRAELRLERDGRALILGITATRMPEEAGLLLLFQDLTGLRRAEEVVRRTERMAELGALSARLAHEIRNPLAAMRSSAQMLTDEQRLDAGSRKVAGILIRETDRLTTLLSDFLKFARPGPPDLADVSLSALAKETAEMLRLDPLASRVSVEVDGAEVRARVDADQVRQVLVNLVRNALQAVPPGGTVRLRTYQVDGKPALSVWDSAGAIPAENVPRIFDPFFTTQPGGTGLGLSTAHSIISAHGGTIEVTSAAGAGTEFVIRLLPPAKDDDAHPGR